MKFDSEDVLRLIAGIVLVLCIIIAVGSFNAINKSSTEEKLCTTKSGTYINNKCYKLEEIK
jgi:hypothetical protein